MPQLGGIVKADWPTFLRNLDNRYGCCATMVVTQVPVADRHNRIPDPTISGAVLDRLIHNAYRLKLKGESRKKSSFPIER